MPPPHRGNMTVTQRVWDIMQLDAQLKIQELFEEWKLGFLGSRSQPTVQPLPENDGGLPLGELPVGELPSGGLEEVPITEEVIDTSGGGY